MKFLLWVRYRLIRLLVGEMPVVMNMAYFRPVGFRGEMWHFPRPHLPGVFAGNEIINARHVRALMVPKRDCLMPSNVRLGAAS